ncbi:Hypothetical predicted protein, partial [Paramuricea clavata]
NTTNVPKVDCVTCGVSFSPSTIKSHKLNCPSKAQDSDLNERKQQNFACCFPSCEWPCDEVISALTACYGDEVAAPSLLFDKQSDSHPTLPDSSVACSTIRESLAKFRQQNKESGPPLRIHLDRMEGEQYSDILALYKSKDISLKRTLRVRFDGGPAVGPGPVSEFFTLSMKLIEEGFSLNEKIMVLEREDDHKGISAAVIHYWTVDNRKENPPTYSLKDVADIELRGIITQLMSDDWSPKTEIKGLQVYLFEANLPPQIQSGENRIAADSQVENFVIDKRRFELDERKKGMDAVSLVHYLRQGARIASIVFPRNSKKIIDVKSMKEMV